MWYTGIDPRTMEQVYVPKDPHEKAMQRALMQWKRPEKRRLVMEALHRTGHEELIGFGKECLLRPEHHQGHRPLGEQKVEKKPSSKKGTSQKDERKTAVGQSRPAPKKKPAGWAKAKPKPNARKKK
jgi:hypothetical protein